MPPTAVLRLMTLHQRQHQAENPGGQFRTSAKEKIPGANTKVFLVQIINFSPLLIIFQFHIAQMNVHKTILTNGGKVGMSLKRQLTEQLISLFISPFYCMD